MRKMAKRVASTSLHRKKRPIKHGGTRKKVKTILRRISNYLKSDTYMYSLLASEKSSVSSPSKGSGEDFHEAVTKIKKSWLQEVEDYLKSDFYLYAPLLLPDSAATVTNKGELKDNNRTDQMEQRTDVTTGQSVIDQIPVREITVMRHVLFEKETMTNVVHQNFAQGRVCARTNVEE